LFHGDKKRTLENSAFL